MSKSKKEKWQLNPAEVARCGSGLTSGRRKHATKSGRKNSLTGATVKLIHLPTDISVSETVPTGHYSRTEMKKLKEQLYNSLFEKLENAVAKHLGISGR